MTASIPGSEVYINGTWVDRSAATVSAFDRGFLFGDGVYEVIPAYNNRPFLASQHVDRLFYSLEQIKLASPYTKDEWIKLINHATSRQDFACQKLYLQVTRGPAPRLHAIPAKVDPTVVLFVDELIRPSAEQVQQGIAAMSMADFRWARGDIKSISLLAAVLSSNEATQAGASEAIMIRDGNVCEGASSNVICMIDGKLCSPKPANTLLRGVTLDYASELADAAEMGLVRRDIAAAELAGAEEIIISSAAREVVAVTKLDGKIVGSGTAGPTHASLLKLYHEAVARECGPAS